MCLFLWRSSYLSLSQIMHHQQRNEPVVIDLYLPCVYWGYSENHQKRVTFKYAWDPEVTESQKSQPSTGEITKCYLLPLTIFQTPSPDFPYSPLLLTENRILGGYFVNLVSFMNFLSLLGFLSFLRFNSFLSSRRRCLHLKKMVI